MPWYSKLYRRHLIDMHIEDWDNGYLSQFSPEEYYENLKTAKVQMPMIYLQSHIGHCYWPTKTGHMHKAFEGREDMMKRLVDLCHGGGMQVVGYYSPTYNNVEHDKHPAWRMVDSDGRSRRDKGYMRYGLCCPNNLEFRDFVRSQIDEMADYFTVEGMFYDMPFWPYECYCDSCKARFLKECGSELPLDISDAKWQLFQNKRREWMGEFVKDISNYTRKVMPGIAVEWNYAFAALPEDNGVSEPVNEGCDYVGGDICKDSLTQSFACMLYQSVSNNQPFEFMTARCEPDLGGHTVTKTEDRLKAIVMRTAAHHGASILIDAIDPVGTMDNRVYERFGKVYEFESKYEPYLVGEMAKDVGVFYSLSSKLNAQGQDFSNYSGAINSVNTLIKNHIPVGVATTETLNDLDKHSVLILSNPHNLPKTTTEKIIDYVANGGTLYFSNVDDGGLFEELVGGKLLGYTESDKTYVGATEKYIDLFCGYNLKYPLPFNYKLPMVEAVKGDVAAKIVLPYTLPQERKFSSIHANPPGIITDMPALVIREYKKGTVIWSAAPIENEKQYDFNRIILNIIKTYGKELSFKTSAPESVEITRFDTDDATYINAVTMLDSDIIYNQAEFSVFVKLERKVTSVKLLPNGEEIPFEVCENGIKFNTKSLHIFDMYEIK